MIILLFGFMVTLAAMPSASVALVITRSVTLGVANGIAVTAGIVLGDLIFILLAIFGLSVVSETMGGLFIVIKLLGAIYLLWLGFSLLTSKETTIINFKERLKKRNLISSFLAGFVLTLGDVKAIIFYVSLFPIFIDLSELHRIDVFVIIVVMTLSVGSVKFIYAFSATKLAYFIIGHKLDTAMRKIAGAFMLGAGSFLIVKAL